MLIRVLFFATLKDRAGRNAHEIHLSGDSATLDDLRAALVAEIPALATSLPTAVASINQEFAFDGEALHDGDEVAFFPPVSGGTHWPEIYELADSPPDLNALTRAITRPETGAVCLFTGTVRGQTATTSGPLHTTRLEYEAYSAMAISKMRQVAAEIRAQWPGVQGIAILQRIGVLQVGEPTVLIACASAHRDSGCFEAARYGIDRLKEIVPVWKKEVGPDGSQWVEGHYTPTPDDQQR